MCHLFPKSVRPAALEISNVSCGTQIVLVATCGAGSATGLGQDSALKVQLQRYEGAAVAPEQLRMTARATAWYLHGGDGAAMMLLQRQGAALRVIYLDGQQASDGGTSETLVVTAPGRADRQRPIRR